MLLHQATNTELAFAIQLAHQNRELSVVLYHCHIFHTGLFVHSFIYALPACFCLPPDVPPPPPPTPPPPPVSLLLFFLSTEQRHVDMRPTCMATREQVSGAFDQLQDQTCPQLPRVHSSD